MERRNFEVRQKALDGGEAALAQMKESFAVAMAEIPDIVEDGQELVKWLLKKHKDVRRKIELALNVSDEEIFDALKEGTHMEAWHAGSS